MRVFLLSLLLLGLCRGERPNLIFILTDDQRRDSLPIHGNTFVETPALDALAAESLVFERASVTSAICTPSRATYLLGQYERRHAVNFNSGTAVSAAAWAKSYPVLLRDSGYFTGYIGKNHVPVGKRGYKTGLMEKSFDFWYAGHGQIKFYPKEQHEIFKGAAADTQVEILTEAADSFLGGSAIEGAESFLTKRPQDQPFCLSICLNVPHGASTSTMEMRPTDPALYRTKYRDKSASIPLPETYVSKKLIQKPKLPKNLLYTEFRQTIYDYADSPDSLRERILRQYQTITGIDLMVGQIRKRLTELGLAENTIIVFSSDHGLMLGEHGLGGKALNYEPCLAVPLIIHDPRPGKKARLSDALAQSIDIAPTLLDFAGVEIPDTMQGQSLVPILIRERKQLRTVAFAENLWANVFGNPRCESVRDHRYKYIRYFANSREPWREKMANPKTIYKVTPEMRDLYLKWRTASLKGEKPVYEELFDLEEDPGEVVNLAADPAYTVTLSRLRKACQKGVERALQAGPAGSRGESGIVMLDLEQAESR